MGGYLLNNFWKPKEPILRAVDSFIADHFKGNYVIGLHIRAQFLDKSTWHESFQKCAQFIEGKLTTSTDARRPVKWFISSDDSSAIEILHKKHPDKVIYGKGQIDHVGYAKDKAKGYQRVLMDIELLARADALIVTSGSSFGLTASMKSDRLNYHVGASGECQLMSMSNMGSARGFYAI